MTYSIETDQVLWYVCQYTNNKLETSNYIPNKITTAVSYTSIHADINITTLSKEIPIAANSTLYHICVLSYKANFAFPLLFQFFN